MCVQQPLSSDPDKILSMSQKHEPLKKQESTPRLKKGISYFQMQKYSRTPLTYENDRGSLTVLIRSRVTA
jgi:hypothetical protein